MARLYVLATLIDAYESERCPIDPSDPIETIKFRIIFACNSCGGRNHGKKVSRLAAFGGMLLLIACSDPEYAQQCQNLYASEVAPELRVQWTFIENGTTYQIGNSQKDTGHYRKLRAKAGNSDTLVTCYTDLKYVFLYLEMRNDFGDLFLSREGKVSIAPPT